MDCWDDEAPAAEPVHLSFFAGVGCGLLLSAPLWWALYQVVAAVVP